MFWLDFGFYFNYATYLLSESGFSYLSFDLLAFHIYIYEFETIGFTVFV